jgi:glucarate dehydratase
MKIAHVKATPVTVPMEAPLRWSMGVETGTTRTIVEVSDDHGRVGIGETYGGTETAAKIMACEKLIAGEDPFELGKILSKFRNYFRIPYETSIPPHVYAGIEMAIFDLNGKILDRPVSSLLGGAMKKEIEVAGYPFWRYKAKNGTGGESTPQEMLDYCTKLVEKNGFKQLKIKGGVLPPEVELKAMRELRKQFGEDFLLRFDPNAAWSVETSIRILKQMEPLALEYVEDPTWGIEGMSLVRKDIAIPLATNMCVIMFDQIPDSVRARAVDIIMGDIHFWGGLQQLKKVADICDTFLIGLSMHSDRELGVSTSAMLHFAASTPYLSHAIDSHYHHQVDDIIKSPFVYEKGRMKVPEGPGLGVEIDDRKLQKYASLYKELGDVNEFSDPNRPTFVANLPLW